MHSPTPAAADCHVRFYEKPFKDQRHNGMNITSKTIWQQAAGDTNRDYSDLCIRWDVILNGPAWPGAWPGCIQTLQDHSITPRKITDLRRFAEEMADGDIVVLRIGTSSVRGVGQVVGPYAWHPEFGDVDGWDLQHIRRVRWLWKGHSNPQSFEKYALKQGDTTQRLKGGEGPVLEWLAGLTIAPTEWLRPLISLPSSDDNGDIAVEEISEFLFDHGVASASITNLLGEIGELTRIAKWYQRNGKPSEHETVAYLVVPLLRALGWTPQRMAVEWNHVDVALFDRLPRSDSSLCIVVEAKKMESSCLSAVSQAKSYAEGKEGCYRLIVTDGLRYGVYVRNQLEPFRLYAYLNLTRLRRDYPIYECKGAEDALLAMTPEWRYDDGASAPHLHSFGR